eukprot:GFUD01014577.1.p2 GENE.GFUD01014577.1~~GFUD01014577.1.p2  ORF type:complete len:208 (+),score=38.60 GFUD01014577.1:182-805(+)
MRHVTNNAKDDKTSKETCQTVSEPNNEGISEDVIFELVVASKGNHATPSNTQGEKYLDAGIGPDIDLKKFFPFWSKIEIDSVHIARKSSGSDQENDKDKIRKESSEIDQFSKRFDSIPQGTIDNNPSEKQAKSKLPANAAKLVDSLGNVEHEIVKKFVGWHFALIQFLSNVSPDINSDFFLQNTVSGGSHDSKMRSAVGGINSSTSF